MAIRLGGLAVVAAVAAMLIGAAAFRSHPDLTFGFLPPRFRQTDTRRLRSSLRKKGAVSSSPIPSNSKSSKASDGRELNQSGRSTTAPGQFSAQEFSPAPSLSPPEQDRELRRELRSF